jgi:hypothetical protein
MDRLKCLKSKWKNDSGHLPFLRFGALKKTFGTKSLFAGHPL